MPTNTLTTQRTLTHEEDRGSRIFLRFDTPFDFDGILGETRGEMCPFLGHLRNKLTPDNGICQVRVRGNEVMIYPIPGTHYKRDIQHHVLSALRAVDYIYKPERAV